MSNIKMHPPADRRCQIYTSRSNGDLVRCPNPGTHWEKWGSCDCETPELTECDEQEFYSWECDGHSDRMIGEAA
jgi:hypothetical protein